MKFVSIVAIVISFALVVSGGREDKIIIQDPFGGPALVLTENNIITGQGAGGAGFGGLVVSRGKKGNSIIMGKRRRRSIF